MKILFPLTYRPLVAWCKYVAYAIGFSIIVIVLLSFLASYHTKKSPIELPSPEQQAMISKSRILICTIDKDLCDSIDFGKIEFRVINLPLYLDIGKGLYLSHYALTNKTDSGYRISLTNHLFDDISATTVFIYHELQHVNISDFSLYDDGGNEHEQCLDHNRVKERTTVFAKKMDLLVNSKEGLELNTKGLPTDYSKLYGNTAKRC
ncbi:hypothetical protein ACJJI4_23755 (plasmid) [Microbulbifer sp. TRSA002]|uniref:hypothetical protein n=1 Tax=Microbulbifer sp. TRSA002 TaxID=3243382 RepID=UPI00403A6672